MPRIARIAAAGMVFHVLNGGVGRMRIFEADERGKMVGTIFRCPKIVPSAWL
jgi:hypothetical protein